MYSPNYCNIKNIKNTTITFEDKSSPVIPRTPSALRPVFFTNTITPTRSVLGPELFAEVSKKQRCPTSPQNIPKPKQTEPIPIVQYNNYLSNELFDPTIVNTPPSEFMNQLNSRLAVYFPSVQ
jgi:hypothetical protein